MPEHRNKEKQMPMLPQRIVRLPGWLLLRPLVSHAFSQDKNIRIHGKCLPQSLTDGLMIRNETSTIPELPKTIRLITFRFNS